MDTDKPLTSSGFRGRLLVSGLSQTIARFGTQGVSALTIAFVTRRLGPHNFGEFSIVFAFVNLWSAVVADPGINVTVLQASQGESAAIDRLSCTSLGMSWIYGPVIAVIVCVSGWATYGFRDADVVILGIVLLSPSLLAGTVASSATPIFQDRVMLHRVAYVEFACSLGILAGSLAVIETTNDVLQLVAVSAACGIVQAVVTLAMAGKLARIRPRFKWDESLILLRRSVVLFLGLLVTAVTLRVDAFLLSVLTSAREVAQYAVAYKIMQAIATLPAIVVATTLASMTAVSHDRVAFKKRTSELWEVMALLAVVAVGVGVPLSGIAVRIVGGSKFAPATEPLQILLAGAGAMFVANAMAISLLARGQQSRLLLLGIVVMALNISINIALIPVLGPTGSAIGFTSTEAAFMLAVTLWLVCRRELRLRLGYVSFLLLLLASALAVGWATRGLSDLVRVVVLVAPMGIVAGVAQRSNVKHALFRRCGGNRAAAQNESG